MSGFVGQFQHTLDTKGRLILPVRFRSEFVRGGHLSPHSEGCVALWTPAEFARESEARLAQSRSGDPDSRRLARFWSANSSDVEFDRQGRFAVPVSIREFARLSGDVLIIGSLDHLELWDPETYRAKVSPAEAIFRDGGQS